MRRTRRELSDERTVGTSPDPAFVPLPYGGRPVSQVRSDAGLLWLAADDGVMLPYLRTFGTWEPEEGTFLRSITRPGDVFVDVGANVGYFVRLMSTTCDLAAVHAFEPHPQSAHLLSLNAWGLRPTATVWPIALGSAEGTVSLSTGPNNVGDTRVAKGSDGPEEAVMVAAVGRMDTLVTGRVDVVKIDVQGYEPDVIRGMARIIAENPQIKLVIEFWPGALRDRGLAAEDVLENYRSMGFIIRMLRGNDALAATTPEIMTHCSSAGPDGQVNLYLSRG